MEAVKHPNCNTVATGDDCFDLPVEVTNRMLAGQTMRVFSSFWKPTPEELEMIMEKGAVIRLSLYGVQIPVAVDIVPNVPFTEGEA